MGNPKAGCRILVYSAALCLLSAADLRADTICYEISGYYDQFGTVDLNTGAITTLDNEYSYQHLAVNNSTLFTSNSGLLYSVNTSSGSLTPLADDFGVHMVDIGSTTSGVYGVGYGTGDGSSSSDLGLYAISSLTGLANLVGLTGLASNTYMGLSTNSSTLYFGDANSLYTIATTTGVAKLAGSFGGGANLYEMGSMTMVGGILYGGDVDNGTIDTINPITGAATPGPISGAIYGLVQDPLPSGGSSTPEPGSSSLLAAGVAGLMMAKRARRGFAADQRRNSTVTLRVYLRFTSNSTPATMVRPGMGTPRIS
jgi:hypothetical protein